MGQQAAKGGPVSQVGGGTAARPRPAWHEVAVRFAEPRECLAAYLALEAAEVIAGVKPANLLSIANRRRACGRNPYLLWQRYGAAVLTASGLAVRELVDRGDSVLLLIYREESLGALTSRPGAVAMLSRAGYDTGEGLERLLDQLTARLDGGRFPHEIGIFLGYPLKDVAGFMGLAAIPFACQGPWKIFGDPRESLRLAETFRCCRVSMADWLSRCSTPYDCWHAGLNFCQPTENECHYPLAEATAGWSLQNQVVNGH